MYYTPVSIWSMVGTQGSSSEVEFDNRTLSTGQQNSHGGYAEASPNKKKYCGINVHVFEKRLLTSDFLA